ncbi:MAG TPA: glutamine--fructose-6-phosphate transaminase (isomerizing) [Firmicutes bacterium]|nr:glutamine--fructose-6-phosphate transaminase (isomerizing) [Bacillota bacterium]
MCGIVGYVGKQQAAPILLDGLAKLEYRGYDSAGIAVENGEGIHVVKAQGKLMVLREKVSHTTLSGTIGIGHTRWATHGAPSDVNSHPHLSGDGAVAVVHNGIIENYQQIKEELLAKGYVFHSETDSETVAHLLDDFLKQGYDFLESVFLMLDRIEGAYALEMICRQEPGTIIAARKNCPLVVGKGEGENYLASDVPALLHHTRDVYFLEDGEVAVVTAQQIHLFNHDRQEVHRDLFHVEWSVDAAEKGGYDHFMIKEIHEQPRIVEELFNHRVDLEKGDIRMEGIELTKETLEKLSRIYVVACGTAYHAGLYGKYLMEKICRIPVVADVASEFRYKAPILDEHTLVIVVSQSGETADTLEALRIAKRHHARVLAIVNTVGSSIAREADDVFYILAGPEISVASTKAFTAQALSLAMICCHMALELGRMTKEEFRTICQDWSAMPRQISELLKQSAIEEALAKKYAQSKNVFYIGRGLDYLVSMESSLKLKEIAYLHSEAYAAGELKHGPIAMIEDETLVIAMLTQKALYEKTLSNIKEVKARGAKVIAITMAGDTEAKKTVEDVIEIPQSSWMMAPLLANVTTQLFAYYVARELGTDIDQPRNLAKSVTVE